MILEALVAFALASSCGPDYITQLPVICDQTVEAPYRQSYPVTPDAQVSVSVRRKPLRPAGSWGCLSWLSRSGVVALVSRCQGIGVAVFRTKDSAPRAVRIQVAGGTLYG